MGTATLGKQTAAMRGPLVSYGQLPSKSDKDSFSEDRTSTGSGSRSPESTEEVQSYKGPGDDLVTRLIKENAKLTTRIGDIETKLSKRMDELEAGLSGTLAQRVDELENGVSVVI